MPQQELGRTSVHASRRWVANYHSSDGQRSWTQTDCSINGNQTSPSMLRFCLRMEWIQPGDNWGNDNTSSQKEHRHQIPLQLHPMSSSRRMYVETTDSFTVSYTFSDADGDAEGLTEVRWFIDGNPAPTQQRKDNWGSSTPLVKSGRLKSFPMDRSRSCRAKPDSVTIIDADSDNDGTPDGQDDFPNDPTEQLTRMMMV